MNFDGVSDRELNELYVQVAEDIAKIKMQLGFAKSEAASAGKYSDPLWFRNASHALRMRGIEHQKIQMERSRRKKSRASTPRVKGVSDYFVDICRATLEPELFEEILFTAKEFKRENG